MTKAPLIPLNGIDFIEYASPEPNKLQTLFETMGFIQTARHSDKDVILYQQGGCQFCYQQSEGQFCRTLYEKS